ncbi:MAG: type II secretion system protein [Chloroflexi bacterium]|nr:type II secretion system protein [Chloroflexota bacterium]
MNRLIRRFLKSEGGFTLVELLVVVAILAVLASIVGGGVMGAKTAGEDSQVKSDAYNMQQAIQRFNTESSRNNDWPEPNSGGDTGENGLELVAVVSNNIKSDGIQLYDEDGTTTLQQVAATSPITYTTLVFSDTTRTRDQAGNLMVKKLVPDFVNRKPANSDWKQTNGSATKLVYAWLLLKGSTINGVESRSVHVFKLTEAGDKYIKIYPASK